MISSRVSPHSCPLVLPSAHLWSLVQLGVLIEPSETTLALCDPRLFICGLRVISSEIQSNLHEVSIVQRTVLVIFSEDAKGCHTDIKLFWIFMIVT